MFPIRLDQRTVIQGEGGFGRVLRRAVRIRWETPAGDCREHQREVEERDHRDVSVRRWNPDGEWWSAANTEGVA